MATVTLWIDPNDDAVRNLPPVCMNCGAPATIARMKRFTWTGTWIFLTKCQRVEVPLCERHKDYWLARRRMIGMGFVVLGVLVISSAASHIATGLIRHSKPGETDPVMF